MAMKTQVTTTEKPVMMSSQEIAELTGKRPANVIRDIWLMLESLYSVNKDSSNLSHHKNQQVTVTDGVIACFDNRGYVSEFLLDRRHTEILITGYDVKRRAAIIDRWFTLEKKSYQPVDPIAALNDPEFLRGTLLGYTEKVIALEHKVAEVSEERDKAIRTKSQISRKREASALGKLSAITRRCRDLEDRLGESEKHATITKVEKATNGKGEFKFAPLRRWCRDNAIEAKDVPDERYGSVKSWPAGAWLAVYGIDLKSLFGKAK